MLRQNTLVKLEDIMTNKQFGLICTGISHILANQEWIIRKLDTEDKYFYLTENTK